MKRLLPLVVLIACGCSQAVDPRSSDTASTEGKTVATPETEAALQAANQGGQTASAFPSITPPTDKASVTPDKYWVDLEMLGEKEHSHHGGRMAPTAHEAME